MHNFLFIPCSHWKAMRAAALCAVRCCLWLCALQNTLERKAATRRCGCCSSICWLAVYVLPTEMQTPRVLLSALCPDPSIHPPFPRASPGSVCCHCSGCCWHQEAKPNTKAIYLYPDHLSAAYKGQTSDMCDIHQALNPALTQLVFLLF